MVNSSRAVAAEGLVGGLLVHREDALSRMMLLRGQSWWQQCCMSWSIMWAM